MQSDTINLITGKPVIGRPEVKNSEADKVEQSKVKDEVATYTRFALPFAFQLQAMSKAPDENKLYYEQDNMEDLSYIKRRKYFTRETADTLYNRGQWLSICNKWDETTWGKAEITVSLRGKDFKIGMLAPQLILFEAPKIEHQDKRNILQTGLLYVDIYFPENQETASQLDDLLVFNEYFRYFSIQNDTHAGIFKNIFSNIPVNPEQDNTIGQLNGMLKPYFERWAALLEIPIKQGSQYFQLFPAEWAESARKWVYNEPNSDHLEHWQIYADNRCYVWTAVFIKNGATFLKDTFEPEKTVIHQYRSARLFHRNNY
jgi:hypothetical protein